MTHATPTDETGKQCRGCSSKDAGHWGYCYQCMDDYDDEPTEQEESDDDE